MNDIVFSYSEMGTDIITKILYIQNHMMS